MKQVGLQLVADDISDSGLMAGRLFAVDGLQIPAVAMFTNQGLEAAVLANPNPAEISPIGDL